jgi:hypothetical protein
MPDNVTLDPDQIAEIKKQAADISASSKLTELYKQYKEIYFMTVGEKPKGNNIDEADWKVTISPTGRNAITGIKRLLDTSEVHIKVLSNGDQDSNSDKIEQALKSILRYSGLYRRARVEKDLNLSAALFGPVVVGCESVADLLKSQKKPVYRKHLEQIGRYTPFLLKAINPEQSSSKWGEIGMLAHLRKYKLTGDVVEERWGVAGLGRNKTYEVWDWGDLENRVAWINGQKDILIAKPHGLPNLNIAARFAGGTSLFDEPEYQGQSFLYAHTKGEWHKRENLFWTYLFTALYTQGLPGPLLAVDPESVPGDEVNVDFTGGIRKIFARVQAINYPVVDGDILQIKNMMDEMNAESTIYKQTLGQSIQGSTFSGLAMLSSAGQLPLEDPKEAIAFAYRDIFCHILERVKVEGSDHPMLTPDMIPDDYELEVTLEPKLPQDQLRNAQTATGLGDLVSDEWKHSNLLQIGDSAAMRKQVVKEGMLKGLVGAMMNDPNRINQLIDMALGTKPQQPPAVGQTPPTAPPEGIPPEGMPPAQGQPNMEQMPMAEGMGLEQMMGQGQGMGGIPA